MSANIGKVVRSRKSEVRSQKKEVTDCMVTDWFRGSTVSAVVQPAGLFGFSQVSNPGFEIKF
jgi:hypothetical protein